MNRVGDQSCLEPGHHLDRYELLCPIARGGMAWVWLACLRGKLGFEKLVAVKTILPQFASDPRFRQMFLDEARIAAGIGHANVARMLDLGESEGLLYLVMEWVDGDSLVKLARAMTKGTDSPRRGAPLPVGIVLRIMADVSAGLHAAHELRDASGAHLGVVHRDVSPQNILVSVNGVSKLIDFGIVTVRARAREDFHAGLLKGKMPYMSPEQAVGKTVDRRSDVWALGAVAYYLLTGSAPYGDRNEQETLNRLKSGAPPPSLPSTYPPELDTWCQRAMARDPNMRTSSADEFQRGAFALMDAMDCRTVSSDLAAFVGHHLAERRGLRYKAIERAVRAAAERRCFRLLGSEAPCAPEGELAVLETADATTPDMAPRDASDVRDVLDGRDDVAVPRAPRLHSVLAASCSEPLRAAVVGVALALLIVVMFALARILVLTSALGVSE